MTPLFEFVQDLTKSHPPIDPSWSSRDFREFMMRPFGPPHFRLGAINPPFSKALYTELKRRTLDNVEVRRLYFVAINSKLIDVIQWIFQDSKRLGPSAYEAITDLLRENEWTDDHLIKFFDWIIFHHFFNGSHPPLKDYLLSCPDRLFIRFFATDVSLDGHREWSDYKWVALFIDAGQRQRLLAILTQIPLSKRRGLPANTYTYLLAKDDLFFGPYAASAGRMYLDQGYLRDAFNIFETLQQKDSQTYREEMIATCRQILVSNDGDTQLCDAAKTLLRLEGADALPQVLQWFDRPYVSGPGPWTMAPGGGRGTALYFAAVHVGPDSLPLLESALAKKDIELAIHCLQCWTQFDHPETESFVASCLNEIVSNIQNETKLRCEALEIGVEWNVKLIEPLLLNCLQDTKRVIREDAARALGLLENTHWPTALEMLGSKKQTVRSTALLLLESIATASHWKEILRLYSLGKNAGHANEWLPLLHTLSAGFGLTIDSAMTQGFDIQSPTPLIPRYNFSKVPPLIRFDGSRLTEYDLHFLLLCQYRSGSRALATEAKEKLAEIPPEQRDDLAFHFMGDEEPHLQCPPWLMPLIAYLGGPRTLTCSSLANSQDFWSCTIAKALSTVKILNSVGGESAQTILSSYQKYYPWFARLPWPGLNQGDLFKAIY